MRRRDLTLLVALSACAGRAREVNEECVFNDDCARPLVCAAQRCRVQCRGDGDCTNGWRCRPSDDPSKSVCVAPADPTPPCHRHAHCGTEPDGTPSPSPRSCGLDGMCHPDCATQEDCSALDPRLRCDLSGPWGVCRWP